MLHPIEAEVMRRWRNPDRLGRVIERPGAKTLYLTDAQLGFCLLLSRATKQDIGKLCQNLADAMDDMHTDLEGRYLPDALMGKQVFAPPLTPEQVRELPPVLAPADPEEAPMSEEERIKSYEADAIDGCGGCGKDPNGPEHRQLRESSEAYLRKHGEPLGGG